ncbi:heat shock protein beta-2 [Malurus melanocephalus]|uniref:heat shock protein beta-2 n=1 Tax=Malurus melanocephalus TaxID=175006 RepID=UPI0025480723|nr:heat shock protein beta-2 [Malurus melanocephalus]
MQRGAAPARHPMAGARGYFGSSLSSHTPPFGILPAEGSQPAAFTLRGSERWGGARPCPAMATRTVPHAYPMSSEYEFANPSKIYDQNFGEGVSPSEILAPALYHGYYIRPRINKQLERGTSEICLNQHKFQVFLDVCQFLPDELSVRTVDNLLEVVGQHPQKADRHGFISREFTRTYILPLDVDPLLVRATLSHDGILSIVAPRTGKELKARVNEVKITQQEQPEGREEQSQEGKEKEKS